jgi:hypothetical protein
MRSRTASGRAGGFPPRRSGSMPVAPARRPPTPVLRPSSTPSPGPFATRAAACESRERYVRTRGVSTTCTGTPTNGVPTGTHPIIPRQCPTQRAQSRVTHVWFVAELSVWAESGLALRHALLPHRTYEARSSASASSFLTVPDSLPPELPRAIHSARAPKVLPRRGRASCPSASGSACTSTRPCSRARSATRHPDHG